MQTSLLTESAPEGARDFIVEAHRSGASLFGAAIAPVKGKDGQPMRFATMNEAQRQATKWNRGLASPNVCYVARYLPEGR